MWKSFIEYLHLHIVLLLHLLLLIHLFFKHLLLLLLHVVGTAHAVLVHTPGAATVHFSPHVFV